MTLIGERSSSAALLLCCCADPPDNDNDRAEVGTMKSFLCANGGRTVRTELSVYPANSAVCQETLLSFLELKKQLPEDPV
jgi:hypothetical protein